MEASVSGRREEESGRLANKDKDYRVRRRGPRFRGSSLSQVLQVNSSGKAQLMSVLDLAKDKEKEGSEPMIARICVQHWQKDAAVVDLQASCRKKGWTAAVAAATSGPRGGASAGGAVLAPTRTAPGLILGYKEDESPPNSKGRIATSCGHGLLPGGIYASSCYLWTNEGSTARNRSLLFKALEKAHASGLPWLIGLDANQTPEEIKQWRWLSAERGAS